MNPDLTQFVREALARGASRDAIREALRQARWPEDEIAGALEAWQEAGLGVPVPRRRVQFSAREAFLYLLLFATLYVVAFHSGAILFALIGRAFPDPALAERAWDRARQSVRFGVASLIVAYPVYLWASHHLGRAIATDPEKRGSGVRRWLTYLTLFVAACVLIGDFIAALFGFLGGELTARFVLKALVVGAIAGALFLHYQGGLRRDESDAPVMRRSSVLARIAGAAVLVTLGIGLVLAGSPARVRREQLDRHRVQQLERISNAIETYHARFGRLPARLDQLLQQPGPGPQLSLRDPATRELVGYRVVDSLSYELCARFTAADSLAPWGEEESAFWRHGPGRACFTFHLPGKP